ncbi:ParA family protein [Treponema sp.]|uniref:ParA family protein n=1 Tax=Treponema sp. TaxID=166 RepID=UPI00298E55C3|nr:ParA family protein [Treponema sp.]MCR5614190.1 ParA family protein [Treponema sp.]
MHKCRIMTTTNGKGGTGKTTLNTFTAETLFARGYKVLLIDLDHNCCLSEMYGHELQEETSKDFLSGKMVKPYNVKINPDVMNEPRIDIIPSDLDMNMLANIMDTQLKIQLKKSGFLEQYDFIILDPPGTWNAQTRNAVFAADTILISGTCSNLDLRATKNYFNQLSNCCLDANVFIVCNKYKKELNPDGIFEAYKTEFQDYLIDFPIPDIKSFKKFVADPIGYKIHPTVKTRLEKLVDIITQEEENA